MLEHWTIELQHHIPANFDLVVRPGMIDRIASRSLLRALRNLSAELAARIAKLLGPTPESWIRMQEALDLWRIAQDLARLSGITPRGKDVLAA